MLSLLASVILVPISYGLHPGTKAVYELGVVFDGFIPILGGQEGKVEVEMTVDVLGLSPDEKQQPRASSEITAFGLKFNGEKFPLGLSNVTEFFPKTTVSLTPQGRVVKTDAPDSKLPFRLPGLDQKRFPDITYLPIEFPQEGIEQGKAFTFKKQFGESDVTYTVTPSAIKEDSVDLEVRLAQAYEVFEDAGGNVVKDEKDALRKVKTDLTGSGKVAFDRKRNLVTTMEVNAEALSKVTDLRTTKVSDRKLKTTLKVKLKP